MSSEWFWFLQFGSAPVVLRKMKYKGRNRSLSMRFFTFAFRYSHIHTHTIAFLSFPFVVHVLSVLVCRILVLQSHPRIPATPSKEPKALGKNADYALERGKRMH